MRWGWRGGGRRLGWVLGLGLLGLGFGVLRRLLLFRRGVYWLPFGVLFWEGVSFF